MNVLKATRPDDSSDSIVISFDGKWLDPIKRGDISLVYRKRGPKNMVPQHIYVYMTSPHCLMLGRVAVKRYETLTAATALARVSQAGLKPEELKEYLRDYESVAAFTVGRLQKAGSETTLQSLSTQFGFTPPQSFFVLSLNGKRMLDEMAGLK